MLYFGKSQMLAKFFSLSISEFFLRGSKFLFFIVLANLEDENVVYEYSYFSAIFSVIFVFSDFGTQTYLTKELSNANTSNFKSISNLRVIFFIFLSIPILIFYFFTQNKLYFFIFLLFLSDAIFAMYYAYLRANSNSFFEAKSKFFISSFYILAFIVLIFLNLEFAFLWLTLAYLFYAILSSNFIEFKFFYEIYKNFNYFKVLKKSIFIFIGALSTIIYLRVDIIMLSWMDTQSSVALYSIASRVLELSLVFPFVISAILLPILTKRLNVNFKKDIMVQALIGIAVLFLFLVFSNIIIKFIFPKYITSVYALNILLFSIPIMLVNNYIFSYFIAKDKSIFYAVITLLIAFLNIVLNFIFIPNFSFIGASYTTLFTEFIGMILALMLLRSYNENSHNS